MKRTRTDWPAPSAFNEEPSMRVWFSVFDDVTPLWSLDGDETVVIPVQSLAETVFGGEL